MMTNSTIDMDARLRRIKGREPRTYSVATRFTRTEEQALKQRAESADRHLMLDGVVA